MCAAFDSRDMRHALSSFATGVTIVTASDADGQAIGMTASSFNSVSMEPPLVLWSVDKASLSASGFKDAKHYAIHVLASNQTQLSNQFAKRGTDKFNGVTHHRDANQVPIIDGVTARFDCNAWSVYEGGDHWIIVGEVKSLERNNVEALVFSDGSYATAMPVRPAETTGRRRLPTDTPTLIDDLLIYNLSRAHRQTTARFHDTVRESGLDVSQWRILASLYGEAEHQLPEMTARTFLESNALTDQLNLLEREGFCTITGSDEDISVRGTKAGHERVKHLFELARGQEHSAMGEQGKDGLVHLINLLAEVIANTRN